jgi:hypothetical protein
MDKKSRNKVTMFRSTDTVLEESQDQMVDVQDFTEYHTEFQANLVKIDELDGKLASDTTGTTEEKEDSIDLVAGEALKASLRLKALARKLGDKKLLNSISFSKSQLFYASDQTLLSRANLILTTANTHAAAAAVYGLTQKEIDKLEALITEFGKKIPDPRKAVIDKKDTGKQLKALVRATDNLLKEHIDVLMELKGIDDPNLQDRYLSAREIIDRR